MKKAELLKLLAEEYKKSVRLPDDISLRDCKDAIERETGKRISDSKATRILNNMPGFTSLLVADRGKLIRVWREAPSKTKSKRK